jgi:phenylacetaldehyde dehydrogenase
MTQFAHLSAPARTFVERAQGLMIGGTERVSISRFDVVDPATGLVIVSAAAANAGDVNAAVEAATRAFGDPAWRGLMPRERARMLLAVADMIEAHARELGEIEALDNGMPLSVAIGQAYATVEAFRYYSGWCTKLMGQSYDPSGGGAAALVYTRREPVGVVGLITPWNFPAIMAAMKLAPALAAGCTCVLKPAEQTPLSALRIGQLMAQAGLPPGVVNIVTGDAVAGRALVNHPGVRKIAFTGSTEVGRQIVEGATGNLKKVSLELGGKSPFIVCADADVARAVAGAAAGIFGNAGQNCVASSRLLVDESIYENVVEGMVAAARAIHVGPAFDPASEMGPLITAAHRDVVHGYVVRALADGGRALAGGAPLDGPGWFYPPTVLVDVPESSAAVREEIFGPVVVVTPFRDEDDAVALANGGDFGLAASVWTRDISAGHRLAARLEAGMVGINTHGAGDFAVPLGGYKQSGWGRENGEAGLSLYLEIKAVTVALS